MNPRPKVKPDGNRPKTPRSSEKAPRPRRPNVKSYLDEQGLEFIKRHEGQKLFVYDDLAPLNTRPGQPLRGRLTAGYGHKLLSHEQMPLGTPVSQQQSDAWLRDDTGEAEAAVQRGIRVPISKPTYTALTSFAYNAGQGNLARSGVLEALNQGQRERAAQIIQSPQYAGARGARGPLQGLVQRRGEEGGLILQPASQYGYVPPTYAPPVPESVMKPQPPATLPEQGMNVLERAFRRLAMRR